MAQINGKYNFVSQDNFEEYLKAAGVGMMQRKVIAKTSPDILVEVNGNDVSMTTVTSLKTMVFKYTLGQEYEADPGTGRSCKYITTREGDKFITKEVADPSSVATREFTSDGLVMTMTTKGVTGTRKFKRA